MKCGEWKPRDSYHKHARCKGGINPVCKQCRKPLSTKYWQVKADEYKIWSRAKSRAKKKGIEFDIEVSDIVIPEVCPVLGGPLVTPSIDRHDPSKGYVKGNVVIMSNRANMLKNNGTIAEFQMIIDYLKKED